MFTTPPPVTFLSSSIRRGLLVAAMLLGACDASTELDPLVVQPSDPRASSLTCGDAVLDPGEQCDDGNLVDDDGCDASCQPSGVAAASTGDGTTCAVTLAGHVKCWGRSEYGQLGRGAVASIGDDERPDTIDFVKLGGRVKAIHTNGDQTFALMRDGSVRAWGRNDSYELGLLHTITIGDDETPASTTVSTDPQLGVPIVQLAVGSDFACARTDHGAIRCWGANDFGQLGLNHTKAVGDDETPAQTQGVELLGPAIDLTTGAHHACAVLEGGWVQCWGLGRDGQLGYGETTSVGDDEPPAEVGLVEVGGPVVEVVAGELHTCARLELGSVRCWGDALMGQLGYGNTQSIGDDEVPSAAGDVDVGGIVVDLAAGRSHTCAVLDDGGLRCWGSASQGELGQGRTMTVGDDETPASTGTVDLGSRVASAVFMGPVSQSTCVVLSGGSLRCWGDNDVGQLGQGHTLVLGDEPREGGGDIPDIIVLGDDDDS